MSARQIVQSAICSVVVSQALGAAAANYSFKKIAGASGDPFALSQAVAINNNGVVAFSRTAANGVQTLYTGRGGALTSIANTAGSIKFITSWDVNRNGMVAYGVEFDFSSSVPFLSATGVFTGNGTTNRLVAKSNDRVFSVGNAAINDFGQVAFSTATEPFGGVTAVVTRYPDRLIAASNGDNLAAGDINNQGLVAFSTFTGQEQMFVGNGGKPTVIAKTEGTDFLLFLSGPRINNAGVVAFNARLDSDGQGIFTASPSGGRTVVDNLSGPFAGLGLGAPAINNRGVVAFEANKFEFHAIYTGVNPTTDRVIQTGDVLDGSTIVQLSTGSHGRFLNDAGQVAFWAQLADGRTGIYRADPTFSAVAIPEPSSLLLLIVMAMGLGQKLQLFGVRVRPVSG
jgi:hypothetical protein